MARALESDTAPKAPTSRNQGCNNTQGSTRNVHFVRSAPQAPVVCQYSVVNTSWVYLPTESVAKESLWLSGAVLLVTGIICCVLCFYNFTEDNGKNMTGMLLQKQTTEKCDTEGRTFYLNMGIISAFVTTILGFLLLRTTQWTWFPKYIFLYGYVVIGCLNLIQCCVLGLLAIYWLPYKFTGQADVAAGFSCVLSFLILFLTAIGIFISTCKRNPPPVNRVALVSD